MRKHCNSAPAQRVIACAGVFICCWFLAACEKGGRQSSDDRGLEIGGKQVDLPPGVTLHDVAVRATGNSDFTPAQVNARAGDVVRFITRDTRTHALVITGPSPSADSALTASAQHRSPPLIAAGKAWVVSLKGLPPGNYRVSCVSHAGSATISVQ